MAGAGAGAGALGPAAPPLGRRGTGSDEGEGDQYEPRAGDGGGEHAQGGRCAEGARDGPEQPGVRDRVSLEPHLRLARPREILTGADLLLPLT